MKGRFEVQNLYKTTTTNIIQAGTASDTTEYYFSVVEAPKHAPLYVVVDFIDETKRDIIYIHKINGNNLYYYQYNRSNPGVEHKIGTYVQVNDLAEYFNYIFDNIDDFGHITIKTGLDIIVKGGSVNVNNNNVNIQDTKITLDDNTTNYIVLDYIDNSIKKVNTTIGLTGKLLATIHTNGGIISNIVDNRTNELNYILGNSFKIVDGKLEIDAKPIYDAIVASDGSGDYITITDAINNNKRSIFVKGGIYNEGNITITNNNTFITGSGIDVVKIVVPSGQDGIKIYANNCKINSMTIDCKANNAESGIVIGDGQASGQSNPNIGNFNTIENIAIYGSDHIFALYLAGPSFNTGDETLQGFENNLLHEGNIVRNCYLDSNWNGDAFSFSLQKNGQFVNNYCKGRVAFYMNRDSVCLENIITNSAGQGIFIGGPVYNCSINNNIINNTAESGIKLQNQLEHQPLLEGQAIKNNIINNNIIYNVNGIGIEISGESGHEVQYNNIENNNIQKVGDHGIYIHNAKYNKINNNTIKDVKQNTNSQRGSGIYMVDGVSSNTIEGNTIDSNNMHTGISNRETSTCPNNIVRNNKIYGTNTERTIWVQSSGWTIEGNYIEGGFYAGIRLLDASFNRILNNHLKGNTRQASNSYYEIWLQGSSNSCIISGNYIIPGSVSPRAGIGIDSTVSNTIIIDNLGLNSVDDNGTDTDYRGRHIHTSSDITGLDAAISNNPDVSENTNARHTHSNKTLLDSLISTGTGNQYLTDNGTYKAINFKDLVDTPNDYVGNAGKIAAVKTTEDGLEFIDVSSGSGDVTGPSSSTDAAVVLFDGTTGKIIKDSGKTIENSLTDDENKIPTSHAVNEAISNAGGGDMLKSTYDKDDDGIVDKAESIDDGTYSATAQDIKDAVDKRHTHSNKTLLDNLTDGGVGDKFLADDGQYKVVNSDTYKIKVSDNDTTEDYLENKIVAGDNITITTLNDGDNETLQISASGGGTGDVSEALAFVYMGF